MLLIDDIAIRDNLRIYEKICVGKSVVQSIGKLEKNNFHYPVKKIGPTFSKIDSSLKKFSNSV